MSGSRGECRRLFEQEFGFCDERAGVERFEDLLGLLQALRRSLRMLERDCASNTRTHSRHICGTRDTSRRLATPSDTTSLIDEIPAKRGDIPFLPGCAYLLRPGDQASETCIKPILRSVASSSSARIIGPPTCCSKSRLLTNELLLSVRERGREEREVQFRDVLPGQLPNCCPIGCGRGDICINGRCEDG